MHAAAKRNGTVPVWSPAFTRASIIRCRRRLVFLLAVGRQRNAGYSTLYLWPLVRPQHEAKIADALVAEFGHVINLARVRRSCGASGLDKGGLAIVHEETNEA
jgi:hypothetical protein